MRAAETALTTLNGRKIFDAEIKVNWAYQGQQNKEVRPLSRSIARARAASSSRSGPPISQDTQGHFHVFVGDLSPEVSDEVLQKAFGAFGTLSDARVMWDMSSGAHPALSCYPSVPLGLIRHRALLRQEPWLRFPRLPREDGR